MRTVTISEENGQKRYDYNSMECFFVLRKNEDGKTKKQSVRGYNLKIGENVYDANMQYVGYCISNNNFFPKKSDASYIF